MLKWRRGARKTSEGNETMGKKCRDCGTVSDCYPLGVIFGIISSAGLWNMTVFILSNFNGDLWRLLSYR